MIGSKEYRKIRDIARQQVETLLGNRKMHLEFTLFAVLQALKLDREKLLLVYDDRSDQSYYIEQHRKELYELAERLYNVLSKQLVKVTMNSVFNKQEETL